MKTIFKKILAIAWVVSIVAMNFVNLIQVQAASVTLSLSTSDVSASTATDITVSYTTASAFSNWDAIKVTMKTSTGALIGSALANADSADTQATNAWDGSFGWFGNWVGTYTISSAWAGTSVALTFKVPSLTAGVYTINVAENRTDSTWEAFGSIQINVWNGNDVTVTAVVEPILAMALNDLTIDLWVLTNTAVATSTNTLTINTNATSWYTVSVESDNANASDWLWNATASAEVPASAVWAWWLSAWTSWFGIYADATTDSGTWDGTLAIHENFDHDGTADVAVDTTAQTLATWNGTTGWDVVTVTYNAAVSAVQEAGNYTTTVTYTIAWSF